MAKIFLVFCFVAMWAMVNGKRPLLAHPTPTVQCTIDLYMDLIGCIDFVLDGSKVANPSIGCCDGLEEMVNVAPNCICQAFNFAKGFGIAVNMTKAQQLPSLCRFSTDIHCIDFGPPSPEFGPPSTVPKSSPSPTQFAPVIPPKPSPQPKSSPPASSSAQSLKSSYCYVLISLSLFATKTSAPILCSTQVIAITSTICSIDSTEAISTTKVIFLDSISSTIVEPRCHGIFNFFCSPSY
ncbi:non-specific lipid transfer protein GPI-anchored 11-like [Magnolia sinica]|uniref:non-specific lipid transfer protein GPI-anchored 11-like n=1 Tax=Magnolia sinica TaxID=86752 RepID=UPI00265B22E0|nr:non-specific lipid transfer protein GPI-anchored 11-like [Magnolia sinica]